MLTNKAKYGLKALAHLATLAPERTAMSWQIATDNNISKRFLDAILNELRNAGFVRSRKGPAGGYALARPAAEIRVGHVIRALDGPLAPIGCASRTAYRPCNDCDVDRCPVRLAMQQARDALAAILDGMSLEDMRSLPDQQPSLVPEI